MPQPRPFAWRLPVSLAPTVDPSPSAYASPPRNACEREGFPRQGDEMNANSEVSSAGGWVGDRGRWAAGAAPAIQSVGHGQDENYEHMVPQLDDLLSPDDMEQAGDLGGEGDDLDSPEVALLKSLPLTPRQFFLFHRMDQAIKQFKAAIGTRRARAEQGEERVPDEVWRRLGDEALGIEPRAEGLANILQREAALASQLEVAKRQLDRVRRAAFELARLADEFAPASKA